MVAEKAATARITGSQRSCNPYDEALVVEDPADNPHILLEKGDRESFASAWLDLVYYHEKSLDEVAEICRNSGQHCQNPDVLRAKSHGEDLEAGRGRCTLTASTLDHWMNRHDNPSRRFAIRFASYYGASGPPVYAHESSR